MNWKVPNFFYNLGCNDFGTKVEFTGTQRENFRNYVYKNGMPIYTNTKTV